MGIRITVDDCVECQSPQNGKTFEWEELSEVVGGLIEIVHLRDGRHMIVNEEGLIRRLEPNTIASVIAKQLIVGNVIIIEEDEIE